MVGLDQLVLLVMAMHMLACVCAGILIAHARNAQPTLPWRGPDEGSDDGWGNDPRGPRRPSRLPGGGLPLPDAVPARVRLRDHKRMSDLLPPRERRPTREPEREPARHPG
jgi:hypothetical protein